MRHAVSTTDSLAQINAAFGLPPDTPAPDSPPPLEGPPGAYIEADQPRTGVAVEAPETSPAPEADAAPADQAPAPAAAVQPAAPPDTSAQPAAPDAPPPHEKQAKGKRKHDLTARIDDLTAKTYALKRENEALRQQLAETQVASMPPAAAASAPGPAPAATAAPPPAPTAPEAVALPLPVESDFATWEDYERALRDYTLREAARIARVEAARVIEQTAQARAAQDRHEALLNQHRARLQAFQHTHPDFLETMEAIRDVPAPPALQEAIVLSERGPALMYYLAQHPDELARLTALPPLRMAAELGKLEASVAREQDAVTEPTEPIFTAPVSKAPPPPSTPARGSAPPPKRSLAQLPPAEYRAKRREQLAARFAGRR